MKTIRHAAIILGTLLLACCGDDWTLEKIADCTSGPAYRYVENNELICDDFMGGTFAARPLQPNETAETACAYCVSQAP